MNLLDYPVPVLGFAAYSGTGKTTLLEQLIPLLKTAGIQLALIKHSHHDFEMDKPGKDSYRLRKAGAGQMLLASKYRTAWIMEGDAETEPDLFELLLRLNTSNLDLVLVEGFRHQAFPKIEIHRPVLGKPLLCAEDENIIALVCDGPIADECTLPRLPVNEPLAVADFILHWLGR
jgi:molybdopterin-guanine dinucleotide biosynthesis protein B